jgi:hypothetical protein
MEDSPSNYHYNYKDSFPAGSQPRYLDESVEINKGISNFEKNKRNSLINQI